MLFTLVAPRGYLASRNHDANIYHWWDRIVLILGFRHFHCLPAFHVMRSIILRCDFLLMTFLSVRVQFF